MVPTTIIILRECSPLVIPSLQSFTTGKSCRRIALMSHRRTRKQKQSAPKHRHLESRSQILSSSVSKNVPSERISPNHQTGTSIPESQAGGKLPYLKRDLTRTFSLTLLILLILTLLVVTQSKWLPIISITP